MTERTQEQEFAPQLVTDQETLDQIEHLRKRAWLANGELPDFIANQSSRTDEHDIHGMHWAVIRAGRLIAAARLCIHSDPIEIPDPESLDGYRELILPPIACFTRLVVDQEFRRQGISNVIDDARMHAAVELGCRSIISICEEPFRIQGLEARGFINLGATQIRYLSYAPSYVLLKRL